MHLREWMNMHVTVSFKTKTYWRNLSTTDRLNHLTSPPFLQMIAIDCQTLQPLRKHNAVNNWLPNQESISINTLFWIPYSSTKLSGNVVGIYIPVILAADGVHKLGMMLSHINRLLVMAWSFLQWSQHFNGCKHKGLGSWECSCLHFWLLGKSAPAQGRPFSTVRCTSMALYGWKVWSSCSHKLVFFCDLA